MKKFLLSLIALVMSVFSAHAAWEQTTSIAVGDVVVLAVDNGTVTKELSAVTTSGTTIGQVVDYTTTPEGVYPLTVVAGTAEGSFGFKNADGAYLAWASGNSLKTSETLDESASWTVTFTEAGAADIYNVGTPARKLQYNAQSPRFACYGNSGQTAPILFKEATAGAVTKPTITPGSTTVFAPQEITITAEEGAEIYYTLNGGEEQKYTAPFTVSETTTIEAYAKVGEQKSDKAKVIITFGPIYNSLAAANEAATSDRIVSRVNFTEALVTYVNGSNAYIQDATAGFLVYGNSGLTVGDKVTGYVQGQLYTYNGLPEVANPTVEVTVVSSGNEVKPVVVDAAELAANPLKYVSQYVTIQPSTFAEDAEVASKSNLTFTSGETALVLRNNFELEFGVEAAKEYAVSGLVTIYKDAVQLYPTSTEDIAEYVAPYVPEFAYAKYIVKNVGSGLYWGAGNDWGTRASLIKSPEFVKIDPTDMPEGQYKLESQVNNGGTQYYFNGDYMDNGNPVGLIITKLANGNYTIALASDGTLYGYDGTSTVLGKGLTNAEDPNAQWTIQSLDEAKAALANATEEAPMNASLLFDDLNFGRNNRYSSKWIVSADCTNKNLSGGNNVNNCAESFHSVFTVNQSVEAPNGLYVVTAQGFYRQDGTDNDNLPVFFANEETMTFPLKTGAENSMSDASASFTNGLYTIEPIYVQVTDGQLNIGTKLETNTSLWCIWDNFQVMYYGPDADVNNVKFAALIAQVDELRAKAEALKENADVTEPVKAVLETALAETAEVAAEEEALNAAIATLNAAIEPAEVCVDIAPKLAAAKRLVESTNVYTAEAKAAYEAVIAEAEAKYQEGTLTRAEASAFVNPEIVAGWHSSNAFDDMLLSAWTINEAQCADFTTALYINTWSVEGETDGSDFKVPFFEYWTGDDASLGTATLTATMNGLEAGLYEVSVLARVRAKDGYTAPTTGITLDVNGGEATDIAAGQQVGTSQFFLAEFKAVGSVAEDGVLKININVAADNNISWLSFKNVNYTMTGTMQDVYYNAALETLENGEMYRVFVEKDGTNYYLTGEGKLAATIEEATIFNFKKVNASNTEYETGWDLGYKFTNPGLSGGSTGDIVNVGNIKLGGNNNRDTYERQVFFLKDGKYAVRATNAKGESWGANTYWDALDGAELPEAGYVLEPTYVWQIQPISNLEKLNELLATAKTTIESAENVGDNLFQKPTKAFEAFGQTVDEAQAVADKEAATEEEITAALEALQTAIATYASAYNYPEEGAVYTLQQKASGLYMALDGAADKVMLAEEPQEFSWVTAEGGFYLMNEEGYVGLAGTNNWTMSAQEAKKFVISPALVEIDGEPYYTLNEPKGMIASDGTAAGDACFADKSVAKSGDKAYWTIAKVVKPTTYILTEDDEYGHWFRPDAGEADPYSFPFNSTFESADGVFTFQMTDMNGALHNHINKNVFKDHKGFRINAGDGDHIVTISVPRGYSITDFVFECPEDEGGSGSYNYATNAEFTDAITLQKGVTITEEVNAQSFKFYLHQNSGVIDVTFKANVITVDVPAEFNYSVDSYVGAFYEGLPIEVELEEIMNAIGATSTDQIAIYSEEPDGTRIEGVLGNTDGWRNAEGAFQGWGADARVYVQDNNRFSGEELDYKTYYLGGMENQTNEVAAYTVKLVYVNKETSAEAAVFLTLNYIEPEPVVFEISDLDIQASVEYETTEGSYVEKSVTLTDEQVASILAELGLESLEAAEVYGYNPTTEEFVVNYAGFDGWRDANGDFHNWSGNAEAPICVKYTDGKTYLCYNIAGLEAAEYVAYWAITNGEKAVLVKINFKYNIPVGINAIDADLENAVIYDLSGRRVSKAGKGIFIINGKKVALK